MTHQMFLLSGISLTAVLLLQGCGGGSDTPASAAVSVTPPTAATPSGKTVVGPISGFGSVIVNGVRYDTRNAVFTIDGNPGTQADLRVGQVVVLKSEKDAAGNAVASSVDYEEILEGPISSIDIANSSLVILGQTVFIDNDTSIDDDISPSSLEGLQLGDILEISGEFNSDGDIVATRIEKSDDQSSSNSSEVHGVVTNLDASAMTFDIGNLTVGFASATLEDFGDQGIANGDLVEVEGSTFLNDGTFVATSVENEDDDDDDREGDEDDEAEISGLITIFDSAERFTVAGVTVVTNSETEFEDGSAANLGLDVRVEVEGSFNAARELVAEELEFEERSDIEVSSVIDAIDTNAQTFSVFGITFSVNDMTRFEDNEDGASQTFSLSNLSVGDFIEVSGYEDANGVLIASKIEREDDDEDETEIEAPVTSIGSNSFTVLGVTVQTDTETEYEIDDEDDVSQAEFFAQLEVGDFVEVEGTSTAAGTLLAEEVSIEDSDNDSD